MFYVFLCSQKIDNHKTCCKPHIFESPILTMTDDTERRTTCIIYLFDDQSDQEGKGGRGDEALPACAFAIERRFGRRALFLLSDVSKVI